MTTQEVANRYSELEKQGKWTAIVEELYSDDVVSVEPAHGAEMGMPTVTTGLDAVKAKGAAFNENVAEMHGGYCTEPVVGGSFFSVGMGMEVTFKGSPVRTKMEEIAVFEVKDGKITKEEFFY